MEPVLDHEPLTRFIFTSAHFNQTQRRVKPAALMPHPIGQPELSVFRTEDLSHPEIWELGNIHVAHKRQMPIKARADLLALYCRDTGLDVVPHEPPKRHANITGWKPLEKDAQKAKALELASLATLVLPD